MMPSTSGGHDATRSGPRCRDCPRVNVRWRAVAASMRCRGTRREEDGVHGV